MGKFGLYTKFKTKPGKSEEMISILTEAAKVVAAAKGCVLYIVNKDSLQENAIWVTEIWESQEAHRDSLRLEGSKELIARGMNLLDGIPEQIRLEVIGGKMS